MMRLYKAVTSSYELREPVTTTPIEIGNLLSLGLRLLILEY